MIEWPAVQLEKWGLVERKPKDYFAEAVEEFLEDAEDIELIEERRKGPWLDWEETKDSV